MTDAETRLQAIVLPFVRANRELEERRRIPHFDKDCLLAALVTGALSFACFAVSARYPKPTSTWFSGLGIAVGIVGGARLLYLLATDIRRHLDRRVMPKVVRELAPLQPTETEIQEVLAVLARQGFLIAPFLGTQCHRLYANSRKLGGA